MLTLHAIRETREGVEIDLQVTANSNETALLGYDEWSRRFKFKTRELARDGKANLDIEAFISRIFGKSAEIIAGRKSKKKTILVLGATEAEAKQKL